MKKFSGLLLLFLACQGFNEEKAIEDITNLIDAQDRNWFVIPEIMEDSTNQDSIRWWRNPENEERIIGISFAQAETAYVEVEYSLSGRFIYYPTDTLREETPLKEKMRIKAVYIREEEGWRLKDISPIEFLSDTLISPFANLFWIKLKDKTLTPDTLFPIDSLPSFDKGEDIEIRAKTTLDTMQCIVFLYTDNRKGLTPTDKDIWHGSFKAPSSPGIYKFTIYTINLKTLSGNWPYDANGWTIWYQVN